MQLKFPFLNNFIEKKGALHGGTEQCINVAVVSVL